MMMTEAGSQSNGSSLLLFVLDLFLNTFRFIYFFIFIHTHILFLVIILYGF